MEMSRTFNPSEYNFSREDPINPSDIADGDISTTTPIPNIRNNHTGLDNPPSVIRYNGSNSVHHDQSSLPPGTACSIQMGSKIFRLSGASIMSDGEYLVPQANCRLLRVLELPHISPSSSRNNTENSVRIVLDSKRCILTEILTRLKTYVGIYKVTLKETSSKVPSLSVLRILCSTPRHCSFR